MSAQPAYHFPVEHPPRFLAHGLPSDAALTDDEVRGFADDPYWTYALLDGALLVSSKAHALTSAELENFPQDPHWKYELLEGTLIVSPNAPGLGHQSCVLSLAILLRKSSAPDLKTMIAPFEYLPVPTISLQPDVLVARRPVGAKRLEQTPVLVAEVLSPATRAFDTKRKRAVYEALGIEHYWVVDPGGSPSSAGPAIQALRLEDGAYRLVAEASSGQTFEVDDPVTLSFDPVVLLDD